MKWSHLAGDWPHWYERFKTRFPHLDDASMPYVGHDRQRFEAHLARTHHLTLREAREEVDEFLFTETLTHEAMGFRAPH